MGKGTTFWLESFLGFEPRLVTPKVRLDAKIRHSGEAAMSNGSAVRAPALRIIPWHLPYKVREKSTGKPPVRLVEMCLLGTAHCFDMAIFRRVAPTSPSIPVSLGMLAGPGSTLGQRRYLLSSRTKRLPTPSNSELNLSVRDRCGRQKTELPNSREFVRYKCTNVHW